MWALIRRTCAKPAIAIGRGLLDLKLPRMAFGTMQKRQERISRIGLLPCATGMGLFVRS